MRESEWSHAEAPRAVIAGASGFIGRALTDALRADGYDVRTIGRGPDRDTDATEADAQWTDAAGIAREKAGIAKAGRPIVTLAYPPEIAAAVAETAAAVGAPVPWGRHAGQVALVDGARVALYAADALR